MQQEIDFYNTTKLSGPELSEAKERTAKQDDVIKKFFQDNPDVIYAPSDIQKATGFLIRSVGRSINSLYHKRGVLERCPRKYNPETKASEFTYKFLKNNL